MCPKTSSFKISTYFLPLYSLKIQISQVFALTNLLIAGKYLRLLFASCFISDVDFSYGAKWRDTSTMYQLLHNELFIMHRCLKDAYSIVDFSFRRMTPFLLTDWLLCRVADRKPRKLLPPGTPTRPKTVLEREPRTPREVVVRTGSEYCEAGPLPFRTAAALIHFHLWNTRHFLLK